MDTRFKRAVAAKCPIEMGRYDSLEQLQRLWNTRRPDSAAVDPSGETIEGEDEYSACIAALKTWNTRYIDRREA